MGNLTKHLDSSEFACKCGCGFSSVDPKLAPIHSAIRHFNGDKPLPIWSGCRCENHNQKVDGAPYSYHLPQEGGVCKAMDVPVNDPEGVLEFLDAIWPDELGIGVYKNRIHVDTRREKSRWLG